MKNTRLRLRRLSVAAGVLLAATVVPGPGAIAARAPEPAATIRLDQTSPRFGDYVTFTTTQSSKIKYPMVVVRCYQGGALVYGEAGPTTWRFQLGGGWSLWVGAGGGGASCAADVYYNVENPRPAQIVLATTKFEAGA